MSASESRRIFTYDEAVRLLPEIQLITQKAVSATSVIAAQIIALKENEERQKFYEKEQADLIHEWVGAIERLGCEVKGLWLIDFDNGEGYFCWQFPESRLEYFHGYTEGFAGRTRLF